MDCTNKNCPAYAKCLAPYRGSRCKATRSTYGLEDPLTNADKIRAMTDEELANELAVIADCSCCNHRNEMDDCSLDDYSCQNQWLDWLREEAKDD